VRDEIKNNDIQSRLPPVPREVGWGGGGQPAWEGGSCGVFI
jgi:hypothetical protein